MRIAQVAPLFESVPPQKYGGTERIVSVLTEELVRQGHQVTLFASGDSRTHARLCAACPRALRTDPECIDPLAYHALMYERVLQEAGNFDLIHFHTDYQHFSLSRRCATPVLHTHHGRLDIPELIPLLQEFRDIPTVSISHAQRTPVPWLNWQATIYHGLPKNTHPFTAHPEDYLAFLGRISPEKGLDEALQIAARVGMRLKVAAKIDPRDAHYFHAVAKDLLTHPLVDFIGEVGGVEKDRLLGNARAVLFPIRWPEPFGLVMIEALACGTPVIAYRRGSVPEIIEHGVTGFVVGDVAGAVAAIARLDTLSRPACRLAFETRFSTARMTEDYLGVYQHLVARTRPTLAVAR